MISKAQKVKMYRSHQWGLSSVFGKGWVGVPVCSITKWRNGNIGVWWWL